VARTAPHNSGTPQRLKRAHRILAWIKIARKKSGRSDGRRLYWVVGHYEGISVASELIAQGKKVHLTIHDDPLGT
jgi:hypothetical protein